MGGYMPNALYQTRTQYRMQNYPTFTTRSHSSSSTQSEYDNVNGTGRSALPPQQSANHHHPHLPPPHASSEAMHNLYNVNTHQTVHYSSADELGKSSSSEDLLNDANGEDFPPRVYLPSKHGSLEGAYRRRNTSGGAGGERHMQRYGSQEHHVGDQPSFVIPNLTPSRFGSKRESTAIAEYGSRVDAAGYPPDEYTVYSADAMSSNSGSSSAKDEYGDFPPPPPPHELNHWEEEEEHSPHHPHSHHYNPHNSQQHHQHQQSHLSHHGQYQPHHPQHHAGGGHHGGHHGDGYHSVRDQSVMESANGVPYMDSAQSAEAHGGQPNHWQYGGDGGGGGGVRQQQPPHTPQTEVPPQPFVQDSPYDSSNPMSPSAESPGAQQVMTVTKYQSYVEVSKPFEMSDFYKYSEKLRKQRNIQSRQQKLEAVLSGQPIPKSVSQESSLNGPPPVPVRYNSYISSTPGGSSPGPLSPVSSAYGSPARPSSPFNSSSQGSQRSSRPSSPYNVPGGGYQSPPSPAGTYQTVQSARTRSVGPYAVQSNLVQTQYQAQSMAYHGSTPHQVGTVPQHTAYQPPKAMSCEPVRSATKQTTPQSNW